MLFTILNFKNMHRIQLKYTQITTFSKILFPLFLFRRVVTSINDVRFLGFGISNYKKVGQAKSGNSIR